MESLTFQYPSWYIILCLLLGAAFALGLYYRDRTFREQGAWLNGLLGVLRFLVVSFLCLLLLSPLLKSLETNTQQPIVVLAQDVSESVGAEMTETEKEQYRAALNGLRDELQADYQVEPYVFGNEVREGTDIRFEDKVSDLSQMLTEVYDRYSNQNLGAVVIATDGIYNKGSNPVYTGARLAAPVYTVALGDTTPRKDLLVKRVFHNRIAYLGDKFSVQVDVAAQNCNGSATRLSVFRVGEEGSRKLQDENLVIDRDDFFTTREIVLDADRSGVQRFRVSLTPVSGEATTANNSKDIFVDVLDARQRILLLANSPHPDLTALRQTLSENKNYEVTVGYIDSFRESVTQFDFVVLHQLPSVTADASTVISQLNQKNVSRMFIVGSQTNLSQLNRVQSLVSVRGDGRNTNDVQGRVAPGFGLFTVDEQLRDALPNFSPLTAPFGEFSAAANAQVLLYQRIGKVDTRFPLLVFGDEQGAKTGVLLGEGLWRWRLFDYLQNNNHELFEELIGKTVQYLSLKEDKRRFRVSLSKNIFDENEPVFFDAELYNESYELINDPDVSITVTSSDGKEFNYTFDKAGNAYTLNAGILPVDNYTFRASVTVGGQRLTYDGQFSVQPIQLELYETTADHNLLRLLSEKYGGRTLYPAELGALPELLSASETIKPVIYQTSRTRLLINLKWIFFLLLALLTLEWFLRRYFGAY